MSSSGGGLSTAERAALSGTFAPLGAVTDLRTLGGLTDGSDCGPLIQAWHDALPSIGLGTLFVPQGTAYTIKTLVKITKPNVEIVGSGMGSQLILDIAGSIQFGDLANALKTDRCGMHDLYITVASGHNAGTAVNLDYADHTSMSGVSLSGGVADGTVNPITGLRLGAVQWFRLTQCRITNFNYRAVAFEASQGNEGHITFSNFQLSISKTVPAVATVVDIINNSASQISEVNFANGHIQAAGVVNDGAAITTYGIRGTKLAGGSVVRALTCSGVFFETLRKPVSFTDASFVNLYSCMFIGNGQFADSSEKTVDAIDADGSQAKYVIDGCWFHNLGNGVSATGTRAIRAPQFTSVRGTTYNTGNSGALTLEIPNTAFGFPQLDANAALSLALNAQTGTTYTLVSTDAGKLITLTNAAAIALTVPVNSSVSFPTGTRIRLTQLGAGQVTVAGSGGAVINSVNGLKTSGQYAVVELIKVATNTWLLTGSTAV